MKFEQRANIKFCVKLDKTFTETYGLMKKVYGKDCLSRTQVYDWFHQFQNGREDIEDQHRSGRPKSGRSEENVEKIRLAIAKCSKISVKTLEENLSIPGTTIFRILTENLGYRKICARFVPHKLTDDQKLQRVEHSKELVRAHRRDPNFIKNIVTGDETWCFQYDPETKRQSAEWKLPEEARPQKSRLEKSKVKTMLVCFYDYKGIVHKEFLPHGQTINGDVYLAILKRLMLRIQRVRPEFRETGSWSLLHDNAPCHRSVMVRQFFAKKQIVTINHSPYSPDLAPCNYFLFPKLKIAMKGHHYDDVDDIKGAVTSVLKAIPKTDIEKSFHALIDRANRCIDSEGNYFE